MPKPAKRPKAESDVQAMSRVGDNFSVQGLFGDGLGRGDEPAVREVPRPGILSPCPTCGGDGFLYERRPNGDRFARDCGCRAVARFNQQLRRASLPDRYLTASFESYAPNNKSQEFALVKARGVAAGWPVERGRGLALIGPLGTGKTHLAVAMLRVMVERGAVCRFQNVRKLMGEVKETFSGRSERTEADVLRPVFEADVVVLDELGAERYTESGWMLDMVEKVINTRYDDNRSTSITSNLLLRPPGQSPDRGGRPYEVVQAASVMQAKTLGDQIGARMLSRLQEMCDVVDVLGDDYRARGR